MTFTAKRCNFRVALLPFKAFPETLLHALGKTTTGRLCHWVTSLGGWLASPDSDPGQHRTREHQQKPDNAHYRDGQHFKRHEHPTHEQSDTQHEQRYSL